MNYKLILFDLDGTLVKTEPDHISHIVNQSLVDMGFPKLSDEQVLKFWFSVDMDGFISQIVEDIDLFWKTFRTYDTVEARISNAKVYDDVGVLDDIKEKGIKMGIITSAPKYVVDAEIELIKGIDFDIVVYAQPCYGVREKPDPQSIEIALDKMKISSDKALMVGNSVVDVLTAQNANVDDIFIKRPEYPYKAPNKATKHITNLYELKDLI